MFGEGWHFILPIAYTTEPEENTIIPPGKVGIVTALGGKSLPPERVLAEEGERGIQRHVGGIRLPGDDVEHGHSGRGDQAASRAAIGNSVCATGLA